MRVILTEQEILMAIEDFILDTVKVPEDVRVDIDLKATRGEQGYTAEIDLLQMDEPEGSRAIDERVEPTEDARAEGLDIVGKIDAARAEAKAPRRRGRPAGSKNLPKPDVTPATAATNADAIEAHPAHETVEQNEVEAQAETEVQAETADTPEVVETPVEEPAPAPAETGEVVTEQPATAPVEAPVEQAAPAAEAPAADASTQTQAKRSLFDNMTTAGDPEPMPEAPVETPADPEPEANSEAALAAEAAATEPAEEDEPDYTPTPETAGFTTAEAEGTDEAPAPAPTRSLFANLTKPTN